MHKITLTLRNHTPFQAQHGVQINHYSTEMMSTTETAKNIAPDTLMAIETPVGASMLLCVVSSFWADGIREIGGTR